MLSEQLKAAKERKKILKEALKREKAHYKEHEGDESLGGFRLCGKGVRDTACYADNYQNRKLGRVGQPISRER